MNTQSITGRMLQSLSSDSKALIESYLLAFGVTNRKSDKLPPVFKDKYLPEWQAFTREFALALPNPTVEKKALYRILEFVRYMKHMGTNPFAKAFKHPRAAKIATQGLNPKAVYEKLLETQLADSANAITTVLNNNQLLLLFKIVKSKSEVVLKGNDCLMTTSFVLSPKRPTERTDALLTNLRGLLYNDSKVPMQLLERKQKLPPTSKAKPKVQNLKADVLMQASSFLGWLSLLKQSNFSAHLIRAKNDQLVLKIQVELSLDVNFGASTKQLLLRLWAKAFKTI